MANQINQSSKLTLERKAVTSLILGIFSGGLIILLIVGMQLIPRVTALGLLEILGDLIASIIFIVSPLISIIGLILGIQSLKSTKRNLAIAGIVLCTIGLLVPLIYLLK